jgi:hypothetical protein
VLFLLSFLDLSELVDVGSFLFSDFLLVDLILGLQSLLAGWIDMLPHIRDDFGEFGDFGIWIF